MQKESSTNRVAAASAAKAELASMSPPAVQIGRAMWMVRLRWVEALLLGALAGLLFWAGNAHSGRWIALLAGGVVFLNTLVWLQLRQYRSSPEESVELKVESLSSAMLALDMLAWIVAAHCTGGTAGPLAAALVFLSAASASLLSRKKAWEVVASLAVVYLALTFAEIARDLPAAPGFWPIPADLTLGAKVATAFFALLAAGLMLLANGFTYAILSRLRNINHRLVTAHRQLAGLDLAKSRFLRMSSHQLRGPLAAVHALSEALQEVGGLSEPQYELMLKMRARLDEAMKQLDEMMLLSTIRESAAETLDRQPVEVADAVQSTAAEFADEAARRGIALAVESDGRAHPVLAWPDAVETVAEHLISNAVKYTPEGGRVQVAVRDANSDGQPTVELEVADTGIGIPSNQQERLFHEFFRATNARQVCGGTGLGLSIVKAVVMRLGGWVAIRSEPGQGTAVTVRLPRADGQPAALPTDRSTE